MDTKRRKKKHEMLICIIVLFLKCHLIPSLSFSPGLSFSIFPKSLSMHFSRAVVWIQSTHLPLSFMSSIGCDCAALREENDSCRWHAWQRGSCELHLQLPKSRKTSCLAHARKTFQPYRPPTPNPSPLKKDPSLCHKAN